MVVVLGVVLVIVMATKQVLPFSVTSIVEDVLHQHGARTSHIDFASRKAEEACTSFCFRLSSLVSLNLLLYLNIDIFGSERLDREALLKKKKKKKRGLNLVAF